jgi:MoaA/NifB/PqqE/SkfB family radical SAM enzyme
VGLATSYYASDVSTHESITAGPAGSHRWTRGNVVEALNRSIPIRVGIIEVEDGQGIEQARAELAALGVEDIRVDRLRQVGRGVRDRQPDVDQLCGRCADEVLAVSPKGDVAPCVFARWLTVGNVQRADLATIQRDLQTVRTQLRIQFAEREDDKDDKDKSCPPDKEGRIPGCPPMDPKKD